MNNENTNDKTKVNFWLYNIDSINKDKKQFIFSNNIISMKDCGFSDLSCFSSREELLNRLKIIEPTKNHTRSSLELWNFSHRLKPLDIVYVRDSNYNIIARGKITSNYSYNSSPEYNNLEHLLHIEWKRIESFKINKKYTDDFLVDITDDTEYRFQITNKINKNYLDAPNEIQIEPYKVEDFLSEVFMTQEKYNTIIDLLDNKKNIILQGVPGVGKSFLAKRLAYSLMKEKDDSRIQMVQFHQNYSYEDFIMGYRPSINSEKQFELRTGVFFNFCNEAKNNPSQKYFFIIDEINRGNLSKIFGELLLLLEADKRNQEIKLLYSDTPFSIPDNVYIIGLMNTADRSLAIIDYALRRRFAFFEIEPAFNSSLFYKKVVNDNNPKLVNVINKIKKLNSYIEKSPTLGRGYRIGHSYFCNKYNPIDKKFAYIDDQRLSNILNYEIFPLLEEYWYDDIDEYTNWINELRESIND